MKRNGSEQCVLEGYLNRKNTHVLAHLHLRILDWYTIGMARKQQDYGERLHMENCTRIKSFHLEKIERNSYRLKKINTLNMDIPV